MHADDTADFDFFAATQVVDEVSLVEGALVDADIGQLTITTIFQLEGQCHEIAAGIAGDFDFDFFRICRLGHVDGFIDDIGGAGAKPPRHQEVSARLCSCRHCPSKLV